MRIPSPGARRTLGRSVGKPPASSRTEKFDFVSIGAPRDAEPRSFHSDYPIRVLCRVGYQLHLAMSGNSETARSVMDIDGQGHRPRPRCGKELVRGRSDPWQNFVRKNRSEIGGPDRCPGGLCSCHLAGTAEGTREAAFRGCRGQWPDRSLRWAWAA